MTALDGKTVLLTGASRGIGAVIARSLFQSGATVVGVARDRAKLAHVCQEIGSSGAPSGASSGTSSGPMASTVAAKCYSIAWDLSRSESLSDLIQTVEQTAGPVDILINNAGIERYRAFQDYTLQDLQAVIGVNLLAAMELSRLLLPSMVQRGSGHIVNMASTAAKKGHPFDSAYSASKAGLLMWSDALRQELVGTEVEISTICPGYVDSSGMMADTGIPAPQLAGSISPARVAAAVIKAIEQNQAEVVVSKDVIASTISKLLFATWQFFPRFGDATYRAIGVPQLNQQRIKPAAVELAGSTRMSSRP
ncbi:MAG: SDR family NAD(P)-dependent oxidoreductase [Phormidesmis sp. RL_2_1]|nr:SDR family NAD(P)-dependent oxidoreductase [Phormidesmis sp. RL_2_1]